MAYVRKRDRPGYVNPHRIDLVGQRFGLWTVLAEAPRTEWNQTAWLCRCECGVERVVVSQPLRAGRTRSCGCAKGDAIARARTTHGASANVARLTPEQVSIRIDAVRKEKAAAERDRRLVKQTITYRRWMSMKRRCADRSTRVYEYYAARGIKVCDRWANSFENFLADMGECPEGLTLDRMDADKGYEPDNCRWATYRQQYRQRRMTEVCPSCGKLRIVTGGLRDPC